jgi:3-deoxy-D-manno-octulosonic-acid transferase
MSTASVDPTHGSPELTLPAFCGACTPLKLGPVINGYDIAWGAVLGVSAPIWLTLPKARRKVLRALSERTGRDLPRDSSSAPALMIHAVSLGEIDATRAMVRMLANARPDLHFVVSTTTESGSDRATELYGGDPKVTLIRYPLDFSPAVRRVLDGLRPVAVVLMELEVWPNFIRHCHARDIPVLVVNGRLSDSSYRNYRLARPLVAPMFRRLAAVCAQDDTYAERFAALGAPRDRVRVTGTMKFDTAPPPGAVVGVTELAAFLGLRDGEERLWVCGSTGPGEETLILGAYRNLQRRFPDLRLAIVPRHKPRFDEVAAEIARAGFRVLRRSGAAAPPGAGSAPDAPEVVLGDTFGELPKFYTLADVVLVARTLVDLGPRQRGSNMIEPAALAKPVVVGPWTQNFADAMRHFRAADAIRVVDDAAGLERAVADVLSNPVEAAEMGRRAQEVVRRQQGATARNVEVILGHLPAPGVLSAGESPG